MKEVKPQMWEDVLKQLKGVSVANESELGVSDILTSVQDSLSNIVSYEAADKPQIKVSNLTREHLRKVLTVFMGSGAYREDGTEYLTPYTHQGTGTVNTLVLSLLSIIADIKENVIYNEDPKLLELLLIDRTKTTNEDVHNIMWATDNYAPMGQGYQEWDEINIERITGENGMLLRPRVNKSKAEQEYRSRDKAEVFTPAWICNKQNNLIDAAWFSGTSPFNIENDDNTWESATGKIPFPTPDGKTWQDYVKDTRLEMACGEAPYLVSRYGVVSGMDIPIKERIGILDRKLRVVSENVDNVREWIKWATIAYQNTYGFEWQGDNLLLAREAMLYTFFDYYKEKFGKTPAQLQGEKIAEIISWNLWQMDGLKGVIPGSCYEEVQEEFNLIGESKKTITKCTGCEKGDITKHNGIYCILKDWEKGKTVRFIDLLNK